MLADIVVKHVSIMEKFIHVHRFLNEKKKIEKNNYVVISCLGALTTSHTLKLTLSLMQICFCFFSLVQTRANIIKRLCEKLYFIPRCWESLEKGNINI